MRVRVALDYRRSVPPLVNDDAMLDRGMASVRAQMGEVISLGEPSLGGEDFAYMAERVPSLQMRIGSGAPGRADKLHNSGYQPDESCLAAGVQALSRVALEILS